MEGMEVHIMNAVDGYCSRGAADDVHYFDSLDVLRCAFNSVVGRCGMMGACLIGKKLGSRRLADAPFNVVRRRNKYDDTALMYLAFVAEATSDMTQRSPQRSEILATAARLGLKCWGCVEEDSRGTESAPPPYC